ncbi:hypothetical protein ACWFR1_37500 [Streptomyces sp. NPDC055103]
MPAALSWVFAARAMTAITRPSYLAELQRRKTLLRNGSFSDASRRRLTSLLAEQAQQVGWAAFDGGHGRAAASLYQESRAYAREAQDGALYSNSLALLPAAAVHRLPARQTALVRGRRRSAAWGRRTYL